MTDLIEDAYSGTCVDQLRGGNMSKNGVTNIISEIEEEVVIIQHGIEELTKRREHMRHRRILNGMKYGIIDKILSM
jgi:hypothetical protein